MYQLIGNREPLGIPCYYSERGRVSPQAILIGTKRGRGTLQNIGDGYKDVGSCPSPLLPIVVHVLCLLTLNYLRCLMI